MYPCILCIYIYTHIYTYISIYLTISLYMYIKIMSGRTPCNLRSGFSWPLNRWQGQPADCPLDDWTPLLTDFERKNLPIYKEQRLGRFVGTSGLHFQVLQVFQTGKSRTVHNETVELWADQCKKQPLG